MQGSVMDVREYAEYAAGHIAGSRLVPLSGLAGASAGWDREEALTLVCKGGKRSEQARQMLAEMGFRRLSVVEGGIDAWRAAGRPLVKEAGVPWAMERQVRIVAGALVLVTMLLGWAVSRYFLAGTRSNPTTTAPAAILCAANHPPVISRA